MAEKNGAKAEVTILGAGIIGVSTALALLERGLSVEIVDRDAPGEATSYGNAGVISPWSCVPQCLPGTWKSVPGWLLDPNGPLKLRWRSLPSILPWAYRFFRSATPEHVEKIADVMDLLMQDNVDVYKRWLAGTGREDLLVDSWYVNVFRGVERPDLADLAWRLRIERGAPVELVDQGALLEIEPAISPEYHSAVLIKAQARARDPGGLCKALAEKARAMGATFTRAEVKALLPTSDGSLSLQTESGLIATEKLVLCAGVWSGALLRSLGFKLPLIAERGYHLEFRDPGVTVNNSINDMAAKIVISAMTGGVRVAGTAEFGSVDAPPNEARSAVLEPLAKRLLPALNTGSKQAWMGRRPSFPDSLPAIGPLPGMPKLIAAFGHSHYGMGMAPATGRIVGELLLGNAPNAELAMIKPARFQRGGEGSN
ncbi:MAG: NAD(P)/FAD-dependent oxidoreductase [Geminicoccaceae bacterium]